MVEKNNLKIKIFGYRGAFNATERIERCLVDDFGCQLVESEPDLLIHLTGGFSDAEYFYNNCNKKPVRLYLLLDIDPSKPISWYDQIKNDLKKAEIPCVLTNTVRRDVKQKLGLNRLYLLPYPIRDVSYLKWYKTIHFLWSGRTKSENKRFNLGINFLKEINFNPKDLIVAGTENPGIGWFVPGLNDKDLNELYNSSFFLLSPSSFEGQNLNICQAVITRTIPIICDDCAVNFELGLEKFVAAPNPLALARKFTHITENYKDYKAILDEMAPKFEKKFVLKAVCNRILKLYKNHEKKV